MKTKEKIWKIKHQDKNDLRISKKADEMKKEETKKEGEPKARKKKEEQKKKKEQMWNEMKN